MTQEDDSDTIYVLYDDGADVAKFGGPREIDAEKLGQNLQKFTNAISRALATCKTIAGDFELREISLEAKLTAEVGFVLVSKAGVEGTVTLNFKRGAG